MSAILTDLLVPGVPILEKVVRSLIVYIFLIVGLRLAGKRELGQLNPFDLVVLMTLSNAVQNAIIGNDNSVGGGLIGAATILIANYCTVRFFYHHQRIDRLVEGQPVLLIDRGRVVTKHLARELLTEDELLVACHRQGVERFADVEKAILETSGTISVFSRHPTREESFNAQLAERLNVIEALLRESRPQPAPGPAEAVEQADTPR